MKKTILVDMKILENKKNCLEIIDKIKKVTVKEAITILEQKYLEEDTIFSFLDDPINKIL